MIKVKQYWFEMKSSFWFIPFLIALGSILLSIFTIELDQKYSLVLLEKWPKLFGLSPEASRGMLSTIASSMMSMMTVAFSMTLVTLALASSQYTSRILRNFMRSKTNQAVLGIFSGTFIYCLIILRTIQGGENPEITPSISVIMGFFLSLMGVGVLVLFIHHIASSIQAANIIASVADETIATIERLFPERMGHGKRKEFHENSMKFSRSIISYQSGYIQNVDEKKLLELSCRWDNVFKMNYGIGDFVVIGMPILFIKNDMKLTEVMEKELRNAMLINRHRTIEQDTLYGIRQIVDVALKALSPGVNDTTTGVMCMDYLTSIMAHITMREIPSIYRHENNQLRIIAKVPDYEKFLDESFSQIRANAKGNVAIIKKFLTAIEVLSQLTDDPERRYFLTLEAGKISELLEEDSSFPSDKSELGLRLVEVKERLAFS
jgi:uncharacterized membrane protein